MDRSFADEHYSETLTLGNGEFDPESSGNHQQNNFYDHDLDHLSHDDESLWGSSPEGQTSPSDLEREWRRRRDQFHTIGYRDGLTAGKEAFAQEGFDTDFKESVHVGYNWGFVRGVTSALSCLPYELTEKLVETQEEKDKFQSLYESVHSFSTTDALKLFHDNILTKISVEQSASAEASNDGSGPQDPSSDVLENYFRELKSLILWSPAVEVNLVLDH